MIQKMKRVRKAELKILILFFYFFILNVVTVTSSSIASQNIAEFETELTLYFACESQGVQPGRICERGFNRMGSEAALIFVYILLGFFPVVSLIYVINYQEMKRKLSKWLDRSGNGSGDFPGTAMISKA